PAARRCGPKRWPCRCRWRFPNDPACHALPLPNGRFARGAELRADRDPTLPPVSMTGSTLRLAVYQFAPELGRVEENARRISDAAASSGADLVLTPELSLTGYDVGDDAVALGVGLDAGGALPTALRGSPDVVGGLVDLGLDGVPYNAAVHVRDGAPLFRHRKVYLP